MRLVRSWPKNPPRVHPQVIDDCERVYINSIDYRPLADLDDDVIHLDWDVAVGLVEIRNFAKKCLAEPDIVRTAPTMMYVTRYWYDEGSASRPWDEKWMAFKQMPVGRQAVSYGDPYAHQVGFGLIYFPKWTLQEFVATIPADTNFRDGNFCEWYYKRTNGQPIPLEWAVNPVHTNYSLKSALEGLE